MEKKPGKPRKPKKPSSDIEVRRILAIDIGGTGLKAAVIDRIGQFLTDRVRVDTPHKCPPGKMVKVLRELVKPLGAYDHISIGFPGYVRDGKVFTAPHLGTKQWAAFPLAQVVAKEFGAPTRLTNDADVQGLGVIKGKGLELVCTLGTGFGTAWFRDGELLPHMELAHFAVHKKSDIDEYIGEHTRKKIGHKRWQHRVQKLIAMLELVMNYDHLYLGGGNAHRIDFELPKNVTLVSNDAGMEGSAFVWVPRPGQE
jgi:polyphosphate glucokinase